MNPAKARIGLGTAQLGMPYGNRADVPVMKTSEAETILSIAVREGIDFFDTASNYGVCEERLGKFQLAQKAEGIEIASKIPRVSREMYENPDRYYTYVSDQVSQSLQRLSIQTFPLIQFHQSDLEFIQSKAAYQATRRLLENGLCMQVGFSVYEPEEALAASEIPGVSAIQFPLNLLDQRFADKSLLNSLKGMRLIARSIFLQGLLVANAPLPKCSRASELMSYKKQAEEISRALGAELERLALQYVFCEVDNISIGVIGVDSSQALVENVDMIRSSQRNVVSKIGHHFLGLAQQMDRAGLNDPRKWNGVPHGRS